MQRLRSLLSDRRFQRAGDLVVAAAVLAGSLVQISVGSREWSGQRGVEIAFALLASVPLVWRRSKPLSVAVAVTVATVGSGMLVAPVQGPFETFVAFAIAFYSVGLYVATRDGVLVLGTASLATVIAWAISMNTASGVQAGDWFPGLVWAWGTWLVGRIIRGNSRRTIELERLTVELRAERDARAREAVTVERARIARELHDVVAHNISVMGVQAAAAGRVLEGTQTHVSEALHTIETTCRETVDEMRRMLGVLRRTDDELTLAPQPGLRDLDALIERVRTAGLDVLITIEGSPRLLPTGLDVSAYRIIQEALTNALKHARPAHTTVTIRYQPDAVELEIQDDGTGTIGSAGSGHGLVGMQERVALFGGELQAGRGHTGGWTVRARLPSGAA